MLSHLFYVSYMQTIKLSNMKKMLKLLPLSMLLGAFLLSACTKNTKQVGPEFKGGSHLTTLADTDSAYIAHIQIDSSRFDSLRNFTVYCFLTTRHGSSHLTVPGNFSVTSIVFYGTPAQSTGTVTIYAGHNYGSNSFSTTVTYPLTFTNSTPSPSSFNGIPIIVQHDPGSFTP